MTARVPLPNHFHFVWLGRDVPLFAQFAIRSVLERCHGAQVTLWHEEECVVPAIATGSEERFHARRLDVPALLEEATRLAERTSHSFSRELLLDCYRQLRTAAARANLLRLLVLYTYGGVYLDTDTLTLRDFAPLRAEGAFCGLEHILWPADKLKIRGVYPLVGGPLLSLVRYVCSYLPRGYLLQRSVERWYHEAANNAVLGFPAGHPFVAILLQRIVRMSPDEWKRRYRLGTHLLQTTLAEESHEVRQYSPDYFYPLGPVVSRHYFRPSRDVRSTTARILRAHTYCVHWYASVSDLLELNEAYLRSNRRRTVYAYLVSQLNGTPR